MLNLQFKGDKGSRGSAGLDGFPGPRGAGGRQWAGEMLVLNFLPEKRASSIRLPQSSSVGGKQGIHEADFSGAREAPGL